MAHQGRHARRAFSAEARAEAAEVIRRIAESIDRRPAVKGITIDGPATREVDDALWLERAPGGGYRLQVSIADVGAWVTPELTPALDQAAYERGFTRYAVNYYEPMLPRALAEGQLSLLEGQGRPTITFTIPLDAQLAPGEPQIAQTVLYSGKQLSYEAAELELDQPETDLGAMLQLGWEVAQRLLQARRMRGALAVYDLPGGWVTTEEGFLHKLGAEERYKAQLITAEFMILANQAAAHFLASRGLLALYRNQKATAIAPERLTLLQMLDTAISHPKLSPPERVGATFQLALERASYAPTLEGHYGLNLPAYLHVTSPLRRYPDLVNQRILLAALRQDSHPYSRAALEEIAASINTLEQEAREARRAHYLSLYDQQVEGLVAAATRDPTGMESLASLDARKFHSVLRIAAEGQMLFPAVEQEILRRLEARQVYAHDLFTLLFRFATSGAAWERVKTAALRELQRTPEYASNLLLMGANALGWSAPHYEITTKGKLAPLFYARVSVTRDGQVYTSAWRSALQKRRAKHLAAVNLALQLAGAPQEDDAPDVDASPASAPEEVVPQAVSVPVPVPPGNTGRHNYKGQLQEYTQARRWERPVYVVRRQSGPSHAPLFEVEVSISAPDGVYSAQGEGGTRIEAEQRAAQQLFRLLPPTLSQEASLGISSDTQTALSVLHELQQKAAIRSVTYGYEQQGQAHEAMFLCRCVVMAADQVIQGIGLGKTKKQAAQAAAAQALASLQLTKREETEAR